jgi:hypothetical protein
LEGTGLDVDEVERAIRDDLEEEGGGTAGRLTKREISVRGRRLEYHSYLLADGSVNVGTYFLR